MDAQRFPSSQYLEDEFIEKLSNGTKRSRLECMKIAEVFLQSPYSHSSPDWNKIKEHIKHGSSSDNDIDDEYIDVDFKQVVTPEVNQVISEINNWFYGQCRFCDVPMAHLWLELLLFHYGHPYHTNIGNHKRYSYTAKKRKMCLDIFTLDKCRALYDWIPMLEYFIYDMQDNNRQMITRMCIDALVSNFCILLMRFLRVLHWLALMTLNGQSIKNSPIEKKYPLKRIKKIFFYV